MARAIVLDSAPLGLVVHRQGMPTADRCRAWVTDWAARGAKIYVPEIVDYELRRELLRKAFSQSIVHLDAFYANAPDRFLPLTTPVLRRAAQMWGDIRNQGLPTAHSHDLDIDVILAAQALGLGLPTQDLVVATSNVAHLSRLVTAAEWQNI